MNGSLTKLAELQQWVLAAITERADPDAADVARLITASQQQTAAERLGIYRHAYLARLIGVLRELLPCTRFAVGEELFDQFCLEYLRVHPPAGYTLARLADRFADFLDASRPADWGAALVELARLELAIDRVFEAPGSEHLAALVLPSDLGGATRLRLAPGCELLSFAHAVSTYYTAWKAGCAAEWPQPSPQYVALLRRDYVVRRYELSAAQFAMLSSLAKGAAIEEAVPLAAQAADLPLDDLAGPIHNWFRYWASEQFFSAAF